MDFVFEQHRTGGDRNFGYLLGDRTSGTAVLVDPAHDPESLIGRARTQGLEVRWVLNTHGHTDHTNGNDRVRELTGAELLAHRSATTGPDRPVDDGDTLTPGGLVMEFLHVPGHAPDHLLVHLPEHRVALTGDLLFVGKIGGTAGERAARAEFESLERVLRELPEETTVWPGHDYGCRPSSTLALEKATNPFLRCADFEAFFELKQTWATFKEEHGLV